jgi:4-hydroxy-tetrahydrodipicolinate reductase
MSNQDLIRVGILGAKGRMGQWVSNLIKSEFNNVSQLRAEIDQGDPLLRLLDTDVIIDFSLPQAAEALINLALEQSNLLPVFVLGSTGWNQKGLMLVEQLAKKTLVLQSSNFSVGINVMLEFLRKTAPLLKKLGYTPVIKEEHHIQKRDAPSGTAISLQRAINPEHPESVQTHSVRAGQVIGDHSVRFYSNADVFELAHYAQDRSLFARGAIESALWLVRQRQAKQRSVGLVKLEDYFQSLVAEVQ